ncbi:MFS transporter [Novosphingobium sp. MMS21-SN21R]|uniref:MFS transporter n=1 Tax=Novosphingobium sp. MMS21-SN21R TaxID=2969298 RepID=UPI00288393F5|nr:MFS transporter [Novosphingobium sp. MMS21-SN21R]MDT0508563.1 MFS transporter [Novosphingobium sp. MMS21-SN21R]
MSPRQVLLLCGFGAFLDGYDIQALGLAIPGLAQHMAVTPTAFAPALSGSLAGMAAGALLLAPYADRIGRRKMMVFSLILIGVTTAALFTVVTPGQLAVWRTATGLGMGALLPLAVTMSAEAAPATRRVLIVTLIASCSGLGSFAAGLLAPVLDKIWGWHGIFAVGAAMPLLAALAFAAMRDAPPASQAERSAPKPTSLPAAVAGLFSAPYRLRTILLWSIFFISLFATYSLISWLPTLLTTAGWARPDAMRATGFLALGSIAGGLLLARAADKGRAVPALASAYVIAAIAFAVIATAPSSKGAWIGLIIAVGAGSIGSQLALGSLASTFYPAEIRATGVGWSSGIGRVGSIFGPLALASMMSLQIPPAHIIGSMALPMALCALLVCLLPKALVHEAA